MARLLLRSIFRGFFATQFRMLSDQVNVMTVLYGSVREAGGAFGKEQAKEEEHYFGEKEQLYALRKHHEEEIDHSKKEIERLQREIDCHKGNIKKLKHDD
uniref:ATPase inhibitor, mitochondrial n=1 Tax=Hucho hucho TaxID=62062 RepID=A0A4W5P461_9TELE